MKNYLTFIVLIFSISFSAAQDSANKMVNMSLHISVTDGSTGEKKSFNYQQQEAVDFDIPAFIANQSPKDHVQLFGLRRNVQDVISYRYDSKNLDANQPCSDLCEKVIKIERVPYIGLAVTPTEDFTGVKVDDLIPGTAADQSSLQSGDVITAIQALDITNPCELTTVVSDQEVDGTIEVEFIRNGKTQRDYFPMGSRIKKTLTWVNCCAPEEVEATINFDDMALNVYPNPTPNLAQFDFHTSSLSPAHIDVSDMTGMILTQKKMLPIDGLSKDYFDFGNYASGVYLITVEQDGKRLTERVIVQRK